MDNQKIKNAIDNIKQGGLFALDETFDEREKKAILACLEYATDPYGDVAHNLKVIVAKLVLSAPGMGE